MPNGFLMPCSAHLEAMQRRQRRVREAWAEFRKRWPAAFTTPVPSAIGVGHAIRAAMPEMTTMRIKEVLGPWMHGMVYLRHRRRGEADQPRRHSGWRAG